MKIARKTVRTGAAATALLGALLLMTPTPAHAVPKEIIALQTQVQQLMDMVQRLQSTVDSRFGVLQHLVEQTADQTNQMTQVVNDLQQKVNNQGNGVSGKIDAVSGQVQSLNDSIDELKTRIAKVDKQLQDMQSQLQNIQNPPPATGMPGDANQPGAQPAQQDDQPNGSGGGMAANGKPMAGTPEVNAAPPLQATFQAGLRDFNAAKYSVAESEFNDVVHYYPMDDLSGSAQFYLGEIAYRQKKYNDAIKAYNGVLEGFSGNVNAPTAQLHKADCLFKTDKRQAGIQELRSLIHRYPQTTEAAHARTKLNGMGVRINPRTGE
ncbi:MAG TPA: tetratricopeptide repeat protein [Terracidiphilus sp.]|nr:tetratricopeptide repeat protein [Terracidiphilus sp.]